MTNENDFVLSPTPLIPMDGCGGIQATGWILTWPPDRSLHGWPEQGIYREGQGASVLRGLGVMKIITPLKPDLYRHQQYECMANIFISYAKPNHDQAQRLSTALEATEWTVWWDRNLPAGQDFDEVIEHELEVAECVIVLWSNESIISPYVKGEAREARDQGKLLPVFIADVKPPMDFRALQGEFMSGWDGSDKDPTFRKLVKDLEQILGPAPVMAQKEEHLKKAIGVEPGDEEDESNATKVAAGKKAKEQIGGDEKAPMDREVNKRIGSQWNKQQWLRSGSIGAIIGAALFFIITAIEVVITPFSGTMYVLLIAPFFGAVAGVFVGAISDANHKLLVSAIIGGVIGWICVSLWVLGDEAMFSGELMLGGGPGSIVGSIVGRYAQKKGWIV